MPEAPYLFVSYASADRERVLPIVERLEAAGVRAWVDRDGIHGGASYALEIAEAIEQAAVLVLMCSPASLASRNVKQEIALAWRFERPYLPLLLEPVAMPKDVAYWLEAAQWIEVLDRPEADWLADVAGALARYGIDVSLVSPMPATTTMTKERPLLVGREREQATLRAHLDRMVQGHGGMMLVGGEAGIGKTTLVEDLSVQAEEAGVLALWGHAYDLSVTPPYGPWLEISRRYQPQSAGLPPVPAFVGNAEELARVGSQERLFTALADFFAAVAALRPLLLVLDDLHWADQASLDFLRVLARQVPEQHLLLVATYRSDELTRRHPLYTLLPLLVREAGAERLDVRPLDDSGHRALIASRYALAGPDELRLERYLEERAEGNPLYARELLRTLEEESVLRRQADGWQVGDLEQARVPLLLRQVIERRLERLPDDTRALLQVAAVIGQDVPLELWQRVSGATDDQLVTAIEQGQAAQLLAEGGGGGGDNYHFRHALLREALYEDLVSLRRRSLHRQVAEALVEARSPDPDAVAHHFVQAGDPRASEWLLKAGERASLAYSWATAAERFEAALAKLTELGAPATERSIVVFRIAMLNRYLDSRQGLTLMREARGLAEEAGQAGLAALSRSMEGLYQCLGGEVRAGLATMEEAASAWERLSDAEREELAAIVQLPELASDAGIAFGTVVTWLANAGLLKKAVALGESRIAAAPVPVLRVGQGGTAYGGSPYGNGWLGLALSYAMLGQPQLAQRAFTQARLAYRTVEHHFQVALTYQFELARLQLPYFADQPAAQLHQFVAEGMAAAQKASGAMPVGYPVPWVALPLLLLQGDWDQAPAVATSMSEGGVWIRRINAGEVLAQLAWAQGDVALATRVIAEVFLAGPSTEPGNTMFAVALPLQRLAVQLALDSHDLPTARAWLEAHDRWLDWSGAVLGRSEGTLLWAAYLHANGDHALARQRAEEALAHASDPRQPLALIAVHRFLGQLDTEAAPFEAAEAHLAESLKLAEACWAPFERALSLLELARLRLAQRRVDEARASLDEVRTICEPLGAKPTLERLAVLEHELVATEAADA